MKEKGVNREVHGVKRGFLSVLDMVRCSTETSHMSEWMHIFSTLVYRLERHVVFPFFGNDGDAQRGFFSKCYMLFDDPV